MFSIDVSLQIKETNDQALRFPRNNYIIWKDIPGYLFNYFTVEIIAYDIQWTKLLKKKCFQNYNLFEKTQKFGQHINHNYTSLVVTDLWHKFL